MHNTKDYEHLFKLLIIGDSGVGKSSLLLRFSDDSFTGAFITTIGVDFKIKTVQIGNERVKLQIWDTAGQERFRTITSTYYRGTNGVIVVYDVNSADSFANVLNWLNEIKNHCSGLEVSRILVGNKDDDPDSKLVKSEDAQLCADNIDIPFFETSAKENINVDQMFMKITTLILDQKKLQIANQPSNDILKLSRNTGSSESSHKKKCCF